MLAFLNASFEQYGVEAILNSFLTFLDDGVSKESGKSCAISSVVVSVIGDSFD